MGRRIRPFEVSNGVGWCVPLPQFRTRSIARCPSSPSGGPSGPGWTKEFLAMVGPEHVMGLAIGNELELLHNHVTRHAAVCCSPPKMIV